MCNWNELFTSHEHSGVLRAGPGVVEDDVEAAAGQAELYFVRIDLNGVSDKVGILQGISAALGFPEYFGMNWDALHDCLTDLAWLHARGYVLLLDGLQSPCRGSDVATLQRVLEGVIEYWRQREVPFYIILAGTDQPRHV
jgi:hypothetical protein